MLTQIHTNQKVIEIFFGEHGQKWLWSVCWEDSKIDCI